MNTKTWFLIPLVLVIACTNDDPDPGRTASGPTIETFAGTTFGQDGDGGLAKAAKLGWITDVSFDGAGNLYITDAAANTIRKVNTSNEISTIAGTFLGWNVVDPNRYSGDGGPATSAHLNVPWWITSDAAGNVFVSDAGNNVLRKINTSGVISTYAGTGLGQGHAGDNGPATEATIWNPHDLVVDASGFLYFADSQNHVIRKICPCSGISTIAGIPEEAGYSGDGGPAKDAKLNRPVGLAIDASGNLYFSDNNSVIRRITKDGKISTIAGTGVEGFAGDGGNPLQAKLLAPKGIVIAKDGSVVFADAGNARIRRISPEGGLIETIAGTGEYGYSGDGGAAIEAKLANPQGMAIDAAGNIYVADSDNSVVRVIKLEN